MELMSGRCFAGHEARHEKRMATYLQGETSQTRAQWSWVWRCAQMFYRLHAMAGQPGLRKQQELGKIQEVLAAQSGVSIKQLCKVVMLESWTGICPGRALATHRGAEIIFCTWEPVEISHQRRNKGRGVLERWLKQQCGHGRTTALLWNLGPDVEKGGSLGSSDCSGTCQAGREESMLATSQMVPRLLRANEFLTLRKDGVCHFYCYKMNTVLSSYPLSKVLKDEHPKVFPAVFL